jgi:uncharacterized protein YjbI with pentapeptide repeats
LYNTHFAKAFLLKSKLHKANLIGADLAGATLYGADLAGAVLHGADLTGTFLHGADLSEANLKDVKGLTLQQLEDAVWDEDNPPLNSPIPLPEKKNSS